MLDAQVYLVVENTVIRGRLGGMAVRFRESLLTGSYCLAYLPMRSSHETE